jgi:tetratricopeptide (TPR) repeat protein
MRITLAVLLSRAGRHEEAIAQARRANAEQREILGPDHREMVLTTANVGAVEAMGGELAAAEQTFADGLRIARREFGDRHPVTSTLLHNLGEVAVDRGDPAAGVPKLVEALAIRKEAYPPGHHARRETFVTLVRAQRAAGAVDDAIGSLRELATELESAPSVDSAELATVLVDLAELEQQRGHTAEAMAALRRAGPRLEDPGMDPALVRRAAAVREAADARDDSR